MTDDHRWIIIAYWRFHLDTKQWNKGEQEQARKTKVKQQNDMENKNSITLQTEASKQL